MRISLPFSVFCLHPHYIRGGVINLKKSKFDGITSLLNSLPATPVSSLCSVESGHVDCFSVLQYVLFLSVLNNLIFDCAGPSLLCRLLSSCGEWGLLSSCSVCASHYGGFSFCRAQALELTGSVVLAHELSSRGSWALEHRLDSHSAQALLLRGMCDLPISGIKSLSLALASSFFTTEPPGKLGFSFFLSFFLIIIASPCVISGPYKKLEKDLLNE